MVFFSTEVKLVLIKERKHRERSNGHDDKICENKKIVFVDIDIHEEWLRLLKERCSHCQEGRKEFNCVYYQSKRNLKVRINEH